MLNRRSLRVKAMQSLFAYGQCKEANYNIGLAEIDEAFKPDLNSMEPQNHELLKANKQEAKAVLSNQVLGTQLPEGLTISKEAETVAKSVYKTFLNNSAKDKERLKNAMILDAESLTDYFLWAIGLLVAWSDLAKTEADKKKRLSPERLLTGDFNFPQNRVAEYFRKCSKLQVASVKKNVQWEDEEDNLKSWYKDIIKKDETFAEYRRTANPTFEQDKELIEHLIKQVVFKTEVILSFFEEKDIRWVENKSIVRSLVTRTVRDLEEDSDPKDFELPDFSNNWEEDKDFFELIYDSSIENDKEYSEIIASKTKNWEIDRLAVTDQIILKMAISEMLNFRSIPVKVTINEYIELSKNYSTPKSKQFINGILDVISNEFKKDGRLKKTGRGLLDNK
ncbi:transcription antitermination factor NusB [Roseivirga pacifica]|uniref:transcription antitermination factor NusB n=1 Tax=Roseivirga pacifica TaxID=1267423 RepID=UPI002095DCEE|nr:transcription antitermination factor NusB [Roseivirga pacifica]MCO6359987.1 transcription antitermination factor NusB [Roseivirga pacifica]MCO6367357.1 transcription antitermination factor NusB [Roseivirga pacifica]MCO6370112.1 transcription antitermination factor NusB [Roseivirga pacifica]MCO6375014.1 transcription antitermination factor NusB [Roseivirga pacifica]MCO6380272.1 transcription antitermination factor NusB [Roseivirga pacifica]